MSKYGDLDRPPLSAAALGRAVVTPHTLWTAVDVVAETASTNALLTARVGDSDSTGAVVIAEHQTAGRGRLDRAWVSPPRAGLTMSVLVRPSGVDVSRWPWIPLLAGLAVAATLHQECRINASLKWPNDVVIEDRKLAGLLVERVEAAGLAPAAIIGIGLNVSLREGELPVGSATSLSLEGAATTDRSLLASALLRTLEGLLRQWQGAAGDPAAGLRSAYIDACSTLGRRVRVDLPGGGQAEGEAVDIDDAGRLVVDAGGERLPFGAGDVLHLTPRP